MTDTPPILPRSKPTTLDRMRDAAFAEAARIETMQMCRLRWGDIAEPMPCQMQKRDDFLGMVRLIDKITSDLTILERLRK